MSAFPAVAHAPAARSPIKVLVADDSAVVRGLVSRIVDVSIDEPIPSIA